jgi:two-component system sensor histidine kinase PilS (NtrC family)
MVALALLLFCNRPGASDQPGHRVLDGGTVPGLSGVLAAVRVTVPAGGPRPQAGLHWLPTIGVDLAVVAALQTLHSGGMNFTPLFGMPILMAAVLGTLTLALGTTAAATLLLLAWATW